ncbi:hypothetical protein M409DRAFT_17430 [Zasmidium cellare ATCC 36951]|uniref:Uncharacterized protein n=1 Tax=Zasmidium cellare ATCC 36951 TaxID=1080233 RepID=A0A6A6D173_ZASCE|nr:uncharacterized protein M409DRAFT_17430 [Zasmidium cellare ATCC 36951]KAF2172190.1 hypothetical protein M409DRAFT_17430 [Zasmidium cellare ATCC 36951]
MNADAASWDSNRWRDVAAPYESHPEHQLPHQQGPNAQLHHHPAQHQQQHHSNNNAAYPPPQNHSSRPQAPQLSAPSAVNPAAHSAILDHSSLHHSWIGKSREVSADPIPVPIIPRQAEPYATMTNASTYHTRLYDRHSPTYAPTQLADTSPRETSAGPWRSLHHGHGRMSSGQVADAPPLTLHIPQSQDRPRISPPINTNTLDHAAAAANQPVSTPSTSLPSFAAFQEHTTTRTDDVDGPEIAPMSSRLSCHSCTKLQPWVRDVAVAVAELDESVQTYCNKSVNRGLEIPNDSLIGLVQWIVDRLRTAKSDVQDAARRNQGYFPQQQQISQGGYPQRTLSPPNSLKRAADRWERDDFPVPKRPRSGASVEQPYQLPALTPRDERRGSIDFAARDLRLGYSPPPSESLPGSAHPRQTSPTFANRSMNRPLPSPSSLAYPPSAAPSLPPPVGSPATSYQPTSTIHSTSNSSATSAHIADLQHQVTLKSLALQTLQSEYASLLQKLQRERVKSQTIEKKTSVADQEVNELTSKNEEMTEQIKTLESQLEESEKKREVDRVEAAKEKEQWGRMLEMGGRLHAKVDSERQRLLEEKEYLTRRVAALETEDSVRPPHVKTDLQVQAEGSRRHSGPDGSERPISQNAPPSDMGPVGAGSFGDFSNSEATALKREVLVLNGRIESLRFALEEARRHNQEAEQKTRAFLEQNSQLGTAIDSALKNDASRTVARRNESDLRQAPSSRSTPARHKPAWSPPLLTISQQPSSHTTTKPSASKHGTLEVINGGKSSIANIADVARARTPGPEELGIHITPSTSSPEELIKALGPVPAPLPSFQFVAHSPWAPSPFQASRDDERPYATDGLGHHVPRPGYGGSDVGRPTGTSPRSYHSSPGEVLEDSASSGSGSGQRSPEGYSSEPDASSSGWNPTNSRSYSTLPPMHQSSGPKSSSYPQNGYNTWQASMPPPPRPEVGTSFHRN